MIQNQEVQDKYIGHPLQGNIKQILNNRKEISIEEILKADEGQGKPRLILMEGAPGIGKSTLAWELCRKWDKFSSMKQYNLVILLRLREEEVQKINSIDDLFYSYDNVDKQSLVDEVKRKQGSSFLMGLTSFQRNTKKRAFFLISLRVQLFPTVQSLLPADLQLQLQYLLTLALENT